MDHEPMRRVAEFRARFDGGAGTGNHELPEHRRTLLSDVLYVTYGAVDALGVDLPAVFVERPSAD